MCPSKIRSAIFPVRSIGCLFGLLCIPPFFSAMGLNVLLGVFCISFPPSAYRVVFLFPFAHLPEAHNKSSPLSGLRRRSKNAGRVREGLESLEFQSWPVARTATMGTTFPWKNRCLADFATGIRRIQAKSGEGNRGGETSSPSASISKSLF